jgi:ankyrin repeat protein
MKALAMFCDSSEWLHIAGGGHLDVCKALVSEFGVSADFRQAKDGRNALHWAARNGHNHVVEWLVKDQV